MSSKTDYDFKTKSKPRVDFKVKTVNLESWCLQERFSPSKENDFDVSKTKYKHNLKNTAKILNEVIKIKKIKSKTLTARLPFLGLLTSICTQGEAI